MKSITEIKEMDAQKSPAQLCEERVRRVVVASQLGKPDRIPLQLTPGYYLAEYGGISHQEFQDNPEKAQQITEKFSLEHQPDMVSGLMGGPAISRLLGDVMTKWPGDDGEVNGSFQFVEKEFMKGEDYPQFLEDPADWAIRAYLPRAFSELKGLSLLPPLQMASFGYYGMTNVGVLANPQVAVAFEKLSQAARVSVAEMQRAMQSSQKLAGLGFPGSPFLEPLVEAPFDFMSDTLRGMRGIFLDMLRRPDELLAAEEKVASFQIENILANARATGMKYATCPLHRGSDGFMSLKQFDKFYWPQLKEMWLELIEHGITPFIIFEGVWDQRLDYLVDLPKGKVLGWFQSSDIFKVHDKLGGRMCIMGGMPNSMLQGSTVSEVKNYTRKVCEEIGSDGGFIMSTAIGELEGSKPELIKAWTEATKEFGFE